MTAADLSTGVLYVATGADHVAEAVQSAASVRRNAPSLPIALITDMAPPAGAFDLVEKTSVPAYDRAVNIRALMQSPFERTLFLDSDTYVCGDMAGVFDILDHCDLAAVPEPTEPCFTVNPVPACFPHYNCGVLLFARNERTRRFMNLWLDTYAQHNAIGVRNLQPQAGRHKKFLRNQPSFREALFVSDVRMGGLRAEYNCRTALFNAVVGPVMILHGRHRDFASVARRLNAWTGHRLFYFVGDRCVIMPNGFQRRLASWRRRPTRRAGGIVK